MAAAAEAPVDAVSNESNGMNGAQPGTQVGPIANGASQDGLTNGTTLPTGLSSDEMALYDRQIRLWGAQAQERIRSAHILLISLRALGTEIAKNLTLAGVSSLTIVDDEPVTEDDLGAQFFLREEDIGKPRAQAALLRIQELNPRVSVHADGGLQQLLTKDQSYYAPFSCVIACDHDIMTLSMINTASNFAARPFYAAGIHGFYGYIFADLIAHEFVIERETSNISTTAKAETVTRAIVSVTTRKEPNGKNTEIVKKQEVYCPLILANSSPLPMDVTSSARKLRTVPALLPCLRALFEFQRDFGHLPSHQQQELAVFTQLAQQKSRELLLPPETLDANFLRSFIQNIGSDFPPTAAFVGGRLSEDVINVLGKREQPIQNFALFDGDSLEGKIYCLWSPPPNLAMAPIGAFDTSMTNLAPMNMSVDMSSLNGINGMQPIPDMMMNMPMDMGADTTQTGLPGVAQQTAPEVASEDQKQVDLAQTGQQTIQPSASEGQDQSDKSSQAPNSNGTPNVE